MKKEHSYSEAEITVAKSRNGVTVVNRGILLLGIALIIFGLIKWGWLSIPIVIVSGWSISILNSILVSNKVERLTGLTHKEQAATWQKMLADYHASKQ